MFCKLEFESYICAPNRGKCSLKCFNKCFENKLKKTFKKFGDNEKLLYFCSRLVDNRGLLHRQVTSQSNRLNIAEGY
jgi:hypothetical protein